MKLSDKVDSNGIAIPVVEFSYCENDKKVRESARKHLEQIGQASDGKPAYYLQSHTHLMGGCRMGTNPSNSVCNSFGQTHDVKNLFIAGSPVFVTAASANPTLTIYALALRTAEYIKEELRLRNIG
jgi:choline dehydrogenase-like flavoprotein